jgi:hypothetical protein
VCVNIPRVKNVLYTRCINNCCVVLFEIHSLDHFVDAAPVGNSDEIAPEDNSSIRTTHAGDVGTKSGR